ncbi:MAG: hypothetical protein JO261_06610 [Alphaproteobacteria bacterium]|nr:hypothetical protein [Alphaproteobacteria bacterium]MBV9693356.1 hypothetical protein [Alphaproteobacteria bacterium]
MHALRRFSKNLLAGTLAALAVAGTTDARTSVLYHFAGGGDGANPAASLIQDSKGNFYGTTYAGGGTGCGGGGCGTVFKFSADGTENVLYAFQGGSDGRNPWCTLVEDEDGTLYGTTIYGGNNDLGTVFKLVPDGTETVLHSFAGRKDGNSPQRGLIRDKKGNLYGTTLLGGSAGCTAGFGCGTVFRLAPNGNETVLYAFTGGRDGAYPYASVVLDQVGNLYGTTSQGGSNGCDHSGCGVVFKLGPQRLLTVLHTFAGGNDGASPIASLRRDKAGNLYGTTSGGGPYDLGIVFKLQPDGTETVLHTFAGGSDGAYPEANLIQDRVGNLYGTTVGANSANNCPPDCGTVFKLAPDGTETVLYAFRNHTRHGRTPYAGLIKAGSGELYGSASLGGDPHCGQKYGCGTVYMLRK